MAENTEILFVDSQVGDVEFINTAEGKSAVVTNSNGVVVTALVEPTDEYIQAQEELNLQNANNASASNEDKMRVSAAGIRAGNFEIAARALEAVTVSELRAVEEMLDK